MTKESDSRRTALVHLLAGLDIAILSVETARSLVLPMRLPVAEECAHLQSALDGMRRYRAGVLAALEA
jgi:hypothetical protein